MRFDELVIELPDEEVRVRFHPALTVLAGLDPDDRRELVAAVVGALTGGPVHASLHAVDGVGSPVVIRGGPDGVVARTPDGKDAPRPIGSMAASASTLRSLLVMGQPEEPRRRREDESAELRQARDALEELSRELDEATRQHAGRAATLARLDVLDAAIRSAQEDAARRRYAALLARIAEVEREAGALGADAPTVDADRALLRAEPELAQAGDAWRAATARRASLGPVRPDGDRVPSDHGPGSPPPGGTAPGATAPGGTAPGDLARLAEVPDGPPDRLDELVAGLTSAIARRAQLEDRLQELAVARLPEPSHPAVVDLGMLDPAEVAWARQALARATGELHHAQVALGGLEAEGGTAARLIAEIEDAHARTATAEREAEATRLPALAGLAGAVAVAAIGAMAGQVLLVPVAAAGAAAALALGARPQAALRRVAAAEQAVLAEAGTTSYLGFHIRRVEATVDGAARARFEQAVATHRAAEAAWTALAGPSISPELADALAGEAEAYRQALHDLGGAADEIERLRSALATEAGPALERAHAALAEACEPYGLDATDVAADPGLVGQAVDRGHRARAQVALERAEVDEELATGALRAALDGAAGPAGDDLGQRLAELDAATAAARAREEARRRARPVEEIEAELAELRQAATALLRPEWGEVTAEEAGGPAIEELERERAELAARLGADTTVDLTRLADRHAALQRRVAALEARPGDGGSGGTGAGTGNAVELDARIAAFLTAAGRAGPHGDPVPVLLDDVVTAAPVDRRWTLLDRLLRLAERHQIIYLTDDAFVAAWARQHTDDGSLLLLEPRPEPADTIGA